MIAPGDMLVHRWTTPSFKGLTVLVVAVTHFNAKNKEKFMHGTIDAMPDDRTGITREVRCRVVTSEGRHRQMNVLIDDADEPVHWDRVRITQ